MAAPARIVLFSWVSTPRTAQIVLKPSTPAKWAIRSIRDGHEVGSRRVVTGLFGWRLIGANNRELGRSANPASSIGGACQAVHDAQLSFGRQVSGLSPHAGGSWSWHFSLDGDQVAVSGRGYHRQRECDYSLEHFREQFPSAGVVKPPTYLSQTMRLPGSGVQDRRAEVAGPNLVTT